MMASDMACGGRDGDVLAVAEAMLRYGLLDAGVEGVRLDARRDDDGTWLRLIFPAGDAVRAGGDAGELMLIDSMAERWGSQGGTELPSTLWVLLRGQIV